MKYVAKLTVFILFIISLVVALPTLVSAQDSGEAFVDSGTFTNADYEIRVPANWNGTLIM